VADSNNHSDRERAADAAVVTSTVLRDQANVGDAAAWKRVEFLYAPPVRWWCPDVYRSEKP
jgi:hypothetical protein